MGCTPNVFNTHCLTCNHNYYYFMIETNNYLLFLSFSLSFD